jgi:NAD(P)-dependent dehydrogenase (short-subunit alcohol dehydrogenase family)
MMRLSRSRRASGVRLSGEVALVTGSSRGLGFLVARELAREGCRLAICSRHQGDLERARAELAGGGADVLAVTCDVSDRDQVERMVREVTARFGRIDILVNNAGVIQVGPLQTMSPGDFQASMDIMFWGVVNTTLLVLPQMRERRSGRIVNITSIAGKVSAPHILPYASAKFAAVGFSEGLRAELSGTGVAVTTVVPGFMRTGSHLNARFKGDHRKEFALFSLGAALPVVSMDAERAARAIVVAMKLRRAELILSLTANVAVRFNGAFPGLTSRALGLAARLLPPATRPGAETERRGMEVDHEMHSAVLRQLTVLGRSAAARFGQHPSS